MNTLPLVVSLACLTCSVALYIKCHSWQRADRIAISLMPFLATAALMVTFTETVVGAFSTFSSLRLTPTLGFTKGFDLFYGQTDGPAMDTLYGPIAYLAYLPAAVAATPTGALIIAAIIKTCFFLIPLYLSIFLANGASRAQHRRLIAALTCVVVTCLSYLLASTRYMVMEIHADGPALGLGLLSCLALVRVKPDGSRAILLAGLLAVLALWAKQTVLPVVLAQLIYLTIVLSWKYAFRYALILLFFGLLMGVLFVLTMGFEPMWFNMFFIPSQHALDSRIFRAIWRLIEQSAVFIPVLAVAVIVTYKAANHSLRVWASSESWFLPLLAALLAISTSLLAFLKIGGDLNSFQTSYYFMAAGAMILSGDRVPELRAQWRGIWKVSLLAAAVITSVMAYRLIPPFQTIRMALAGENLQQQAYEFDLEHPGLVYFPWSPLASLLAESRLYHMDGALVDRRRANVPLTPEHYKAYLPAKAIYLAIPRRGINFFPPTAYQDYFDLSDPVQLEGLENFEIWEASLKN